jgi:hypothetical protein
MGRMARAVIPEFRVSEISGTQERQYRAVFFVPGSRLSAQSRSGRDDRHG